MSKRILLVLGLLALLPWAGLRPVSAQADCPVFAGASVETRTGYYMGEGMGFLESGNLARALASFSCVTDEINPQYVPGYMARAAVYSAYRSYNEAIADYTTATRLDASYSPAYNNRGIIHAARQDYDLALADFNRAIDLNGGFALAYTNRAIIQAIQGDYETAVGDLEQAISLSGIAAIVADLSDPDRQPNDPRPAYNPDHAQAYALLGMIHSAWALDNYRAYLLLTGSQGDARIQSAAGALESRFTFDLRLDDGSWLLMADFSPAG